MAAVSLGDRPLDLQTLLSLSLSGTRVRLAPAALQRVRAARRVVAEAAADGGAHYGINTGFGKLKNQRIPERRLRTLQRNLLLSHASGVGEPLPDDVVRLALALRIHNLAHGHSGVRLELLEQMVAMFNGGAVPAVPAQGSVGASGDLAPLAHLSLPLIGKGQVRFGRRLVSGATALKRLGLRPLELAEKEGLALINGTQIMTAMGLVVLDRARSLSVLADAACATSLEAQRGSIRPFEARVHRLRPHRGQQRTASNVRRLLAGSRILPSHVGCSRVQDPYSLRCSPQVHGASKDAIAYAEKTLLVEAQAVTDNPLVFHDGAVISAGNFHGQPVSQALDVLKIGLSTLANISERRTAQLVDRVEGDVAFLVRGAGVNSGFMIPQVVAAALASENKTLAHPASVDTIPTSAGQEDHVSMGVTAARHAAMVASNTARVLAIELLCGCQGLDLGEKLRPGVGVAAVYRTVRRRVRFLDRDRFLAPDIAAAEELVLGGVLRAAVDKAAGPLHPC